MNKSKWGLNGKFFHYDGRQRFIKGVTYGPFVPGEDGQEYSNLEQVKKDFILLSEGGFNLLRIPHMIPNKAFLDLAGEYNLWILPSLALDQYMGYFIDRDKKFPIADRIKSILHNGGRHPQIMGYSLGNEIDPAIIRWLGRKKSEKILERFLLIAKDYHPDAFVTYMNFPTTEYLDLSFLDFLSFNIYLDDVSSFNRYLPRLQNQAGNRPLLLSEIGVDSQIIGDEEQKRRLKSLMTNARDLGVAGHCLFNFSDDWYVNGPVEGWTFGLTDHKHQPKPAFEAAKTFHLSPRFDNDRFWLKITVVICTFNGERYIGQALGRLKDMKYPNFDVIVIDDGSTDNTRDIASSFPVRLISTENRGLSAARNLGWQEATGEIIAYLDDDAYPSDDWLYYLSISFSEKNIGAVGGGNFPPQGRGLIADAITMAPGGPKPVLFDDTSAEHTPGCNLSVRKRVLEEIGGFDQQFRVAGDDVDLCWRILDLDYKIGFHNAAFVWHYARDTIPKYWRQQSGYGKAEAMLEAKWPEKYNHMGTLNWQGRIYGDLVKPLFYRQRVYHGVLGQAPFQLRYEVLPHDLCYFPLLPEWSLLSFTLLAVGLIGLKWQILWSLFFLGFLGLVIQGSLIIKSVLNEKKCSSKALTAKPLRFQMTLVLLHYVYIVARLYGRIKYRITPWWKKPFSFAWPWKFTYSYWSLETRSPDSWFQAIESKVKDSQFLSRRGSPFDYWDLETRGGFFGKARAMIVIENHGTQQMLRFKAWPHLRIGAILILMISATFSYVGFWFIDYSFFVSNLILSFIILVSVFLDFSLALGALKKAVGGALK